MALLGRYSGWNRCNYDWEDSARRENQVSQVWFDRNRSVVPPQGVHVVVRDECRSTNVSYVNVATRHCQVANLNESSVYMLYTHIWFVKTRCYNIGLVVSRGGTLHRPMSWLSSAEVAIDQSHSESREHGKLSCKSTRNAPYYTMQTWIRPETVPVQALHGQEQQKGHHDHARIMPRIKLRNERKLRQTELTSVTMQ